MATSSSILESVGNPPPVAGLSEEKAIRLEKDICEWTDKLFETATTDREREKEVKETLRLLDYLEGRQWSNTARRSRNRPVLNKLSRHFWDGVGLLTDLAIDFQVRMWDKLNDFCYDDQTEILTRDRGFVLFEDLTWDDEVATRSTSGDFQWQ